MDPQQRLALQVAYEAVQDSAMANLRGRTGVFIGISTNDFRQNLRRGRVSHGDIFAGTGSAFSIAANRISHRFDLKAEPCHRYRLFVGAGFHRPGGATQTGTCEMALAGGVNCMLDPGPFIALKRQHLPTGGITFGGVPTASCVGCGFVL